MNVSVVLHERLYYKDFDVNESIQCNYYFFSYCIFISKLLHLYFPLLREGLSILVFREPPLKVRFFSEPPKYQNINTTLSFKGN